MWSLPKAQLYSGTYVRSPLFTGLEPTPAPPLVLDSNPQTFFLSARTADFKIGAETSDRLAFYRGENLGSPSSATLVREPDIPVEPYQIPADASQCGTAARLDTLDGRFVTASTQVGNTLWQVHSTGYQVPNPIATLKYYEIDTASRTVRNTGPIFVSGSSEDFNTSIAAYAANDAATTWSSTDTGASPCANAEIRADHIDAFGGSGGSVRVASSDTFELNQDPQLAQRWGDYSSITVDPAFTSCRFWLVNERIRESAGAFWSTQIAQVNIC